MAYSYTQDRPQLLLRGKKNERKYLNGKKVPAGLFASLVCAMMCYVNVPFPGWQEAVGVS